jgi:hypothetical protein
MIILKVIKILNNLMLRLELVIIAVVKISLNNHKLNSLILMLIMQVAVATILNKAVLKMIHKVIKI